MSQKCKRKFDLFLADPGLKPDLRASLFAAVLPVKNISIGLPSTGHADGRCTAENRSEVKFCNIEREKGCVRGEKGVGVRRGVLGVRRGWG